jgi:tetratricopeptide (TPR) repeat protein
MEEMPMLKEHPVPQDFERFLRSASHSANPARNALLIRHLLAGCSFCCEQLSTMGWDLNRLDRLLHLQSSEENTNRGSSSDRYSYSGAFANVEQAIGEFLALDRPAEQSPEDLFSEIASLAENEQLSRVASKSRFASPQFVRWLVACSHAARYEDAKKMLHLAQLARVAAEACSPDAVRNERRLADLRARAWGQFGNALRVNGKLTEAEDAMLTASRYCAQGTGDPPLHARLLEQAVSLQMFRRRFEIAIELAEEAGQIYKDLGDTHQLASTLVQKAIALLYSGEAEQAAHLLNHAIPLMDYEEDPHLLLAACHNLVHCYVELDRPEQGLALYFKAKQLYREFKDSMILLRTAWQEGQLLRDLGHLREAETALLRARKGFMERGLAYEVAVVSLDLSSVYARLSAVTELKQTVAETMPIFRALRVGREILASLIQLQQVADQEHQALELIRFLTDRLGNLPNHKGLAA